MSIRAPFQKTAGLAGGLPLEHDGSGTLPPASLEAVRGAVGGVVVAGGDVSAASANRAAIQAALDAKGRVGVSADGIVWVNGPVYVDDDTDFYTTPGTTLKQVDGTNALMIGTKALIASWTNVSIAWTSGRSATMTWAGHPLAANDAVVLQGVHGTTAADWFDVVRVASVTDGNTVELRLNAVPAAAPTGQITAKRCHRNVQVDVQIDYNKTGNPSGASTNFARMGAVAAFVADGSWQVRGNDLYKYVLMVAGADNVQGRAVNGRISNSDTLKYYGPINNCEFGADGRSGEDCASWQAFEPPAFIDYMPCRGLIRGARLANVSGAQLTAGSGAVVLYGDDTYSQDGLVISGGRLTANSGSAPALAIKGGTGFTVPSGKLRSLTLDAVSLAARNYAAVDLLCPIDRLVLRNPSFDAPDGATVKALRVPNGGRAGQYVVEDMRFEGGAWPTATGYFMEVSSGGIIDTLIFRRIYVRGSANLRFFNALAGSAVKTVVFEDCDMADINTIARMEQAGFTVIIRGGVYSNVLGGVNARASGNVILEGSPQISGMTNGMVRAELASTVVNYYADSAPVLASGSLLVALSPAVVNIKSDQLTVDIGATGVNKAAGNRAFNTSARGTIPANVPVVCDGTNWYNACNLSQTF